MAIPPGPVAKVCSRCRQDCSNRPRVRDATGVYTCKACLRVAAAGQQLRGPRRAATDDTLPLAGEAPSSGPGSAGSCWRCSAPMARHAVLCVQCGFDRRGALRGTSVGVEGDEEEAPVVRHATKKGTCPTCGYSLKGLKDPRCPECGTIVVKATADDIRRDESDSIARWAYITPIAMVALGLAGLAVYGVASGHLLAAVWHLVLYVVTVPVGAAAYFGCCALWIGFDEPWRLSALRIAGVYAVVDLALVLCGLVPLPVIGLLLPAAIYLGLLAVTLELELVDALAVFLATSFAQMLFGFTLFAWVYRHV